MDENFSYAFSHNRKVSQVDIGNRGIPVVFIRPWSISNI